MSGILPTRSETRIKHKEEPRVIEVDSGDAGDVFNALSSDMARKILAQLYEEPGTSSEIADRVDTSLQNVRYHIGKLEEAGLIETVDTWYSSKGKEMNVYAPSNGPVVLLADEASRKTRLKNALLQALGIFVLLGAASLAVQLVVERYFGPGSPDVSSRGPSIQSMDAAGQGAETTASSIEALLSTVPPGVLFFAGGVFIIMIGATWWYLR
ncbi:MAG: helix-turn-helix domain-containing protein [Halobacteria archaeon]|nr:helix-turn-helix domain-containing protein [Halobacteria archaeon]